MNLKTVITLSFLALINSTAIAGKVKLQDLLVQVKNDKSDIKLKNPIPFINQVELRVGRTNSFDSGRDIDIERNPVNGAVTSREVEKDFSESSSNELTLRVKVDNLEEYSLKRKLAKNQAKRKKILNGVNQVGEAQLITELYINLKLSRKKLFFMTKLNDIYRDKVKVLKTMSRKGSADIVDYLDAENKLESNSLDLQKQKLIIANTVNTINSELGTNYKVVEFAENEKLISVDYIEKTVNKKTGKLGLSSKLAKFELEKIDLQDRLNTEKRYKIIEFVDLRYQEGTGNSTSELLGSRDSSSQDEEERRVGIRVGLRLPWVHSDLGSVDKSLDNILKKRKAKKSYYNEVEGFEALKDSLISLIKGIKSLKRSKALSEAKKVLKVYSKQKGTAPLRLLKLSEFITFERIKKIEYELELYTRFYQYVYETDRLELSNGQLLIKG